MKRVYLMGPILGKKYEECNAWREFAKAELAKYGIEAFSPMRHKDIVNKDELMRNFGGGNIMTTEKGIITRDRYDATHCELGLANLLNTETVSIGTAVEYGWMDLCRTPVITVMEKNGNPHDHTFIREISGYRVETLEEGIYIARCILTL